MKEGGYELERAQESSMGEFGGMKEKKEMVQLYYQLKKVKEILIFKRARHGRVDVSSLCLESRDSQIPGAC